MIAGAKTVVLWLLFCAVIYQDKKESFVMSQVISVTPEQLKTEAQVYTRARDGIEAEAQKVNSMNNQIAQQWKGKAFEAYLQQYNELYKHVQKFEQLLTDINQQLNKYADTIQQRDQQDAQSFGLG